MSGGSWNYVYQKFNDAAYRLANSPNHSDDTDESLYDDSSMSAVEIVRRRQLAPLIEAVGKIMHAIEWYDSCNTGEKTLNAAHAQFVDSVKEWVKTNGS